MKLHSQGQKDCIKELKKQQSKEINETINGKETKCNNKSIIQKIRAKFNKLIKDSDQALFVTKA